MAQSVVPLLTAPCTRRAPWSADAHICGCRIDNVPPLHSCNASSASGCTAGSRQMQTQSDVLSALCLCPLPGYVCTGFAGSRHNLCVSCSMYNARNTMPVTDREERRACSIWMPCQSSGSLLLLWVTPGSTLHTCKTHRPPSVTFGRHVLCACTAAPLSSAYAMV